MIYPPLSICCSRSVPTAGTVLLSARSLLSCWQQTPGSCAHCSLTRLQAEIPLHHTSAFEVIKGAEVKAK